MACSHLDLARRDWANDTSVCAECVVAGDIWVHLRRCLLCGEVACCDASFNRHAQRHFQRSGHPLIESVQPGEDWMWCYIDRVYIEEAAE